MTTPRLRPELSATPTEEQGIKFFDVSDPRSGNKMRLYDFEWLLASQMDGQRSHDELARWAKGALHLDLSSAAVAEYAERLGALGFFATPEVAIPMIGRTQDATSSSMTPLPPPRPGVDTSEELELSAEDEDTVTVEREALPRADATLKTPALAPVEPEPSLADSTQPKVPILTSPPAASPPVASAQPKPTSTPFAPMPEAADAPARSGKGSMIGLVLVLLAVGGVIAYVKLFADQGVKVTTLPAKSGDVVRLFDGAAKLEKAPPHTINFTEAGKVVEIVAQGTEVKAGMPLATLDGYTKTEKELADVKDRLGFYQKQLEAATAKGDANAQKSAEAKVAEKKKLLADIEAQVQKQRVIAPGPGVVEKVHATVGADVKPESPAVDLSEKHAAAVFTIDKNSAATMKAGEEVTLQPAAGGANVTGKVSKVEGDKVSVEVGDDAATGDMRLVKARLTNVVTLPTSAVASKKSADFVFVLSEGAVHQRQVKIVGRNAGEVYVGSGLQAGESVVTSDVSTLTDGQKANVAQ